MDKKYSEFNLFDWSDERWQAYLSGIYPPPNYRQLLKFRKKWYKRTIDPEFDVDYEPGASSSSGPGSGGGGGDPSRPSTGSSDDVWASSRYIWTMNCFLSYLWTLVYSISSAFKLVDFRIALVILSASVALELLARHGIQFRRDYLQLLLREDVGPVPVFAMVALEPGLQRVHALLLLSGTIAALLSLAQISPALPRNPLAKLLRPVAHVRVRRGLMQARADIEVLSGFLLIWMCIGGQASFFAPLWIWNALAIRYAMSPWTQASFRKIDRFVRRFVCPVFGRIPLVSKLYEKAKLFTHVFAENKQNSSCTIL